MGSHRNASTAAKRDRETRQRERRQEKAKRRARGWQAVAAERERRDGLLDAGEA
jgi:hypothetical protein